MYPELFQAIILKVPFLDICNTLLDPSLPLTILDYEEFGNPQIRSQFQSILSYSPYDNVEDRFPAVLKLEKESWVLCDFHVIDVEVQGQYFTNQAVAPDHTLKFDRVGADIPIVRRHGSSFRRLTLIGSDGSQRHFIVQTSLTPNARSDERILHLFRVMNQMFDKHKESRRRHICIHTPIIIHVWSQTRPRVEASASLRWLVAPRLSAPQFAVVAPVEWD